MQEEFKQKLIHEVIAQNPFAKYLGVEVVDIQEGYALGRVHFEQKHMNLYGGMHGGCSYALADTIGGISVLTYGKYVTTVNSSMNYMKRVIDTEYVYCEAEVIHHGNRISTVRVRILNDERDILMEGTMTYYALHAIEMQ